MENNKIKSTSQFSVQVQLVLTESEARALLALTVYGDKSFLDVFYKNMGQDALKPHENGLKSLFSVVAEELPKHLRRADDTRGLWNGTKKAINTPPKTEKE